MKFAFLGAGKMSLALAHGMLRSGLCQPDDITVASRGKAGLEKFTKATGGRPATTNAEAVGGADVIILGVKPADAMKALADAGDAIKGKLLISVVTGLKISFLESAASGLRVVRTMPNTAAMVGKSATALAAGASATDEDIKIATQVCQAVGEVYPVAENQLDAVTGLSGSGPAFIYLILEALSDAGVSVGLPRKLALDLAIQTLAGSAEMAASTQEHPAVLREMVTSPGGTTIAGLTVLENAAVRAAFVSAVKAAAARAKELSGN